VRFMVCLLVLVATGDAARSQPIPAVETFVYKAAGAEIKADVYRPGRGRATPAILWLHGGGLIFGSRTSLTAYQRDAYLAAGHTVIAADYRLAPQTKLAGILADLTDVHAWTNAGALGIDPTRIGVVGHSAGGYLALMSGIWLHPRPRAIVSFYGYGDLSREWLRRPDPFYLTRPRVSSEAAAAAVGSAIVADIPAGQDRFSYYVHARQHGLGPPSVVGLAPLRDPDVFARVSPIRHLGPAFPPTLLLHGDADTDVPFEEALLMEAALARAQVPHRLVRLRGKDHNFDRVVTDEEAVAAFRQALSFLDDAFRPDR
jgi:acetyl esterase/lipase